MKLLPTLLMAATLALAPALQAAGESMQQMLSDGQTAFMRGDLPTAKRNFQIVTELDPKNPTARNFLRLIAVQEAKAVKTSDTERQLTTVILPKVELREATLGSALEFLRQQVTKASGGKTNVNFVLQLSEAESNTPVTLNLREVPASEALRYLGDLGNVKFEYEKYAVRVRGKGGVATAVAPAPAQAPVVAPIPGIPGM